MTAHRAASTPFVSQCAASPTSRRRRTKGAPPSPMARSPTRRHGSTPTTRRCRRSSARGRECSRYIRCIRYYAPPVFGRWHFNDKSPLAFLWGGVVASPWGAGLISPSVIALIWPSVVLEQFVHDVVAVAMRLAVYSPTVLFVTPHRQRASSVTSITSVTSVTSVISVTSVTSVTAVTSVTFRRHLLADCRKRRLAT